MSKQSVALYDRKQVLSFYGDYINQHGRPPTVREVQSACGFGSTSTAYREICKLAEQGKLSRTGGIMRGTTIKPNGQQTINVAIPLSPAPASDKYLLVSITDTDVTATQPLRNIDLPIGVIAVLPCPTPGTPQTVSRCGNRPTGQPCCGTTLEPTLICQVCHTLISGPPLPS